MSKLLWDEPIIDKKIIKKKPETSKSTIKLKKGETIDTLILTARALVNEKLGKYRDTSLCVIDSEDLIDFFNETSDNSLMAIDTETTRLI